VDGTATDSQQESETIFERERIIHFRQDVHNTQVYIACWIWIEGMVQKEPCYEIGN
jgi:hypothetical protein